MRLPKIQTAGMKQPPAIRAVAFGHEPIVVTREIEGTTSVALPAVVAKPPMDRRRIIRISEPNTRYESNEGFVRARNSRPKTSQALRATVDEGRLVGSPAYSLTATYS